MERFGRRVSFDCTLAIFLACDIENKSDYSSTSMGVTGGLTFGQKVEDKTSGPTSGKNTGGVSPMIPQHESGSQHGVAQSGIAAGTITITDQASQNQDIAALNRDTINTNATVGKGPDLNNVLGKQADMMAAAQAAGEAVAKTVGDVAGSQLKKAEAEQTKAAKAYEANPTEENGAALAQANADVAGWKEGGAYRAALHAAGGAMIAGLGGGNAIAGAVGAGVSSLAAEKLATLGKSVESGVNSGNKDLDEAIGNLAANLAAGGIGAAVGGGSGAATAANADRFNRQLHPLERKLAQRIAEASDGKYTEQQISDALRAASNSALGESVVAGMVVDGVSHPQGVFDTGAAFTVPSGDGRTLVQAFPAQVDPNLAEYVQAMTGGDGSPYTWDDGTLGSSGTATTPLATNPFTPAPNGCITAECAAGLGQQGRGLLPDYATVSGGSLSGTVGRAVNLHDGKQYFTAGVVKTNSSAVSFSPGLVTSFGWIIGAGNAAATNSFMKGDGNHAFISIPTPFRVNGYVGVTHAYGGSTAIEFGIAAGSRLSFGIMPWGHSSPIEQTSEGE